MVWYGMVWYGTAWYGTVWYFTDGTVHSIKHTVHTLDGVYIYTHLYTYIYMYNCIYIYTLHRMVYYSLVSFSNSVLYSLM